MSDKILFVDDEPPVLEGYKRLLGRDMSVDTAVGGVLGLSVIATSGPYAVVVSDMRMPTMSGAQFLSRVRDVAPTTVRLALTGYVDIETAMSAVNDGNIFRFLTKPCSRDNLTKALEGALTQHHLQIAEKELLEQTLRGAINLLSEVLSFSNPAAFGRAMRLRGFVQHVARTLNLSSAWHFEIAAVLSQLGCVTLPPELMNSAYAGDRLAPEDQKKYDSHPAVAWEMLRRIPRMEAIAQMIANQNSSSFQIDARTAEERQEIELGIQLLQVGLTFESWLGRGLSPSEAAKKMRSSSKGYDSSIMQCLDDMVPPSARQARECSVYDLAVGMVLEKDICNGIGLLIVAKGQELTYQWIERLKDLSKSGVISRRLSVWLPRTPID